ncbi:MAG: pyrimidine reductase family protein [Acidimicrobiales bacterium]
MRQLYPEPAPIEPRAAHAALVRPAPAGRPWVLANMVVTIDGATALAGVSGGLSGPADKAVFGALRAVADVILVGAGTARDEGYRAPRLSAERQSERVARGQAPFPRIALVSRSLDLDPSGPLFTDLPPGPVHPDRPLLYTVTDAPSPRRDALTEVAEVVDAGEGSVSMATLLGELDHRGTRVVLAEGGPSLIGQLLSEALVDEIDVTTSPQLICGPSPRLAHSSAAAPLTMDLAHLWEDDGFLFARYLRR